MFIRTEFIRRLSALIISVAAGFAHAGGDPMDDPEVQSKLRAMDYTSMGNATWYHPDLFGEYAGMHRYARHQYKRAMENFELGAYYADKLSQISIGLLYLNGEGVEKDPGTAYAWIDLAAERNYPEFIAERDHVKASLTSEQLVQATQLRKKLEERYGDAVAKPRMALELRRGAAQKTGTRAGANIFEESCGPRVALAVIYMRGASCGIWSKENWDPKQYFATRDAQYRVTVGAVEESN